MSFNHRLCQLGLIAGLMATAPLWAQNPISISCPALVAAGSDVTCSISLALDNAVTINSLTIGVGVAPNGQAPDLDPNGLVNFDTDGIQAATTVAGFSSGGYNDFAVVWNLKSKNKTLSGNVAVGTFDFIVPANAAANQSYNVSFSNAAANLNSGAITITSPAQPTVVSVIGALTITAPTAGALSPQATALSAYSQTFTAAGGNGTYNWTINANSLPTGLSFTSANNHGTISGTPASTAVGAFNNIVVTATDTEGTPQTASLTYSLQVNAALSTISPNALPAGSQGTAYSQALTVTGGSPSYTWTATGLPTGLTIASPTLTGQTTISGTPTVTANAVAVSVTVKDANNATQTANYTLTINGPLSINASPASPLPTATVGVGYPGTGQVTTLTAAGGTAPYTWTLATGSNPLPAGLGITTVAGAGVISGTPTTAGGPVSVTVQVADNAGAKVTASYSITVNPALTVTLPATLPGGTQGVGYPNQTAGATGGSGSYTWTMTGAPTGLSINASTGVISGTPTQNGSFNITVTATDAGAGLSFVTANKVFNNVSFAQGVSITGPAAGALANATVGIAYTTAITSSGGTGPFTWSLLNATTLPTGLTLSGAGATGTISGTPSGAPGTSNFTVQVMDNNGSASNRAYSIQVFAVPTLNSATLPIATVGSAYNAGATNPFIVTGGAPTIVWSALGLPGGLTISSTTGAITGTPAAGANTNSPYTVTIKATDANGAFATATPSLVVDPALSITTATPLPQATMSGPYAPPALAATGGSGTGFTWALVSGSTLPAGLSLSAAGAITGTPTAAGTTNNINIMVTDSTGASVSKAFTIVVNAALNITTASPLPAATQSSAYAPPAFAATGGTGTLVWTQTNLPANLSLSAGGLITGTPTTAATTANLQITVTDANNATISKTFSLTVNPAIVVGGPASLPVATVSSAYTSVVAGNNVVTLTGGTPAIVWTVSGLPNGLIINAGTGVITGTPTTNVGTPFTVKVTATDANNASSFQNFSLVVNPALAVSPAALPVAIPSVAYNKALTASGGSGAGYAFTAAGLPAGLAISGAGVISGTPAANSNVNSPYHITITVTDSIGATATFPYTLAVAPPLSISGPSALPPGIINSAYSPTTVSATGGTTPYTFSATGLPAGLSINSATGAITGTPTTVVGSPFAVVVKVTDANGTTATSNLSIAVSALPLQIITGLLPTGVIGAPYPYTSIQVQGGAGTYTYTITGLPAGLTTDGSGNISGTPTTTTGSPFTVKVTVTDASQTSVSRTFSLAISNVLSVVLPTTLPSASLNTAYAPVTVTAGGGLPPYTFSATGLPTGMSIAVATGVISGTPTTAAGSPYTVVVTVTDGSGKTAVMNYSLVVNSPLTVSGPAGLPNGVVGTAYTATTVTATGGSGVYTWSATGLPAGLSINASTGAVSGTPTVNGVGTAAVVVTVTDSSSATATKNYSITVTPGASSVPVITSVSASTQGQNLIGPNTWVSVYGSNFQTAGFTDDWTKSIKNSATGALPILLDGVGVKIGGIDAYVAYVSASQINVLTPNVGFGPLQVTVTNPAGTSNAVTISSQQDTPGLFEWPTGCTANCQPVATHNDANFSYAVANGTIAGLVTVAAKPGETIILWGSGFGPTNPAYPFGVAVPASTFGTSSNVTASLNGTPLVVYQNQAFLTSANAGLYQIGITVPAGLANGTYPLSVTIGGVTTPNSLVLTVQQ